VAVGSLGGRTLVVSGGEDGTVRLWEMNGSLAGAIALPGTPTRLATGRGGSFAVATSNGLDLIQFES
jgi:hypothetical protein